MSTVKSYYTQIFTEIVVKMGLHFTSCIQIIHLVTLELLVML